MAEPGEPGYQESLPDDAEVFIVNKEMGKRGVVSRRDLADWQKAGYELETPAATRDNVLQREYGDSPGQAFVEGAARGVTLGLSDVVLGRLDEEGFRERKSRNKGAAIAGEVVGSLIPGGGGALAGRTGVKAGAALGSTAAIQGLATGGKAAKALARYAPAVVRGGAEGALFGVGSGVSHVALSADPMSVESVLGEIASEAFLGFGIGGALGLGGKLLSESTDIARAHVKRATTPTIADNVIALAPAGVSDDVQRIARGAPRANGQTTRALRVEREALDAERAALPGQIEASAVGAGEQAVGRNAAIGDFKTRYHKLDTSSRQNIRQMEGRLAKGEKLAPELEQAAIDLEAARRATRKFLPVAPERSYNVRDRGEQGRSLQSWTGTDDDIVAAVQQPAFRDALQAHQAALDNMQALLGNKAYPPVVGDHGVFGTPLTAPVAVADPALVARLDEVNAKFTRLETLLSGDASAASKARYYDETIALAEKNGMTATEEQLALKLRDAGVDGLTLADLPAAELSRLKAEVLRDQAKEQIILARAAERSARDAAKAASKEASKAVKAGQGDGGPLSALLGETAAEKAATVVGGAIGSAVGVGPWLGGMAGRTFLGGPMRHIVEALTGRVAGKAEKLAAGVDTFLAGAGTAARSLPRTTGAILSGISFASLEPAEPPNLPVKATASERAFHARAGELATVLGDPTGAQRTIHESLAGVRLADPLLADQLEDLAFRRVTFLASKMPKAPDTGTRLGKPSCYRPSDAEMSKWARYLDAAENPGGVVDALQGGTLSMEQVETLEALFPATYQRLQADIVTRAGELQTALSWQQRLTLSTLFRTPVDGILRPDSVLTLQATFAPSDADTKVSSGVGGAMQAPEPTAAQTLAS